MSAPPSSLHIRTVGVIGAGLSGIVTATHLLRAGIDVTVFERSNSPGGAWKFTPEADRDPPFPSIRPPAADWDELEEWRGGGPGFDDAVRIFDPPNPVYANMKSRGSEEIMRTSLEGWPEGKRAPLDHTVHSVFKAAVNNTDVPVENCPRHRRELTKPPNKWKDLENHPLKEDFIRAAHVEIKTLIKLGAWRTMDRENAT